MHRVKLAAALLSVVQFSITMRSSVLGAAVTTSRAQLKEDSTTYATPSATVTLEKKTAGRLLLPNNATFIREEIIDSFSCNDRIYGYYADMENDCQVFHVCLPRTSSVARWSFICPSGTVFNQATFVCTRIENSIPCQESNKFYNLNEAIGNEIEEEEEEEEETEKKHDSKEDRREDSQD